LAINIDPKEIRDLKDRLAQAQSELAALRCGAIVTNQADDALCARCARNIKIWSDDILLRLEEWQALLAVTVRVTGMEQADIVALVVREREERDARANEAA
jgi:hypothetical protein